jgi:dolichol kinase
MLLPGVYFSPKFQSLAYGVAIAALLLLEWIKLGDVPPLSAFVTSRMAHFTDKRDVGLATVTHIYLLAGCAIPLWLSLNTHTRDVHHVLTGYAGLLILGVGDTVAAAVGSAIGKRRWPGTPRTVEGTAAAFVTMMLFLYVYAHYISDAATTTLWWVCVFIATLATCLLEALTDQIDNLILSLYYFSVIVLCGCV